jgi:hypothetical protein
MKHSGQAIHIPADDLFFLDADQIRQIDRALTEIGEFGEVRLIKAKGKLRFIQKLESEEIGNNRRGPAE